METDKLFDTRNIARDVRKYLMNYAKAYVEIASKDLTSIAQKYIQNFYVDYSPIYYDRTFDFRDNSYEKIFEHTANGYRGGVLLTWKNMSPYTKAWNGVNERKTIDPSIVWADAIEGFHGARNSPHLPKTMKPSPMTLINEYYNKNVDLKNNKYKTYAKKYADSQRYLTFGF